MLGLWTAKLNGHDYGKSTVLGTLAGVVLVLYAIAGPHPPLILEVETWKVFVSMCLLFACMSVGLLVDRYMYSRHVRDGRNCRND